jgi:hypothetical protein
VPLLQPMYAIFSRDNIRVPVAIFPFSMEGRDAALTRLRELEAEAERTETATPPTRSNGS